jgi:hypothetical protein
MNLDLLENNTTTDCIICLENINSTTTNLTLNCQHTFHKDCIDKWFQKTTNNSCPICRAKNNTNQSNIETNILNTINFNNEREPILFLSAANILIDSILLLSSYDGIITSYTSFLINWIGFLGAYTLNTLYLKVYLFSWIINFFITLIEIGTNFNEYRSYYLIASFIFREIFTIYFCVIISDLVQKINTHNNRYLVILDNY